MADNITVTEGVGKIVSTDEVTRGAIVQHMQVIKLALGTENEFDNLVDSGTQLAAASIPVVISQDPAAFESLVTYNYTSVTGAFTEVLNPAGNLKYIEIQNNTNANIIVSFDGGVNPHWRIPLKEPRIFDVGQFGYYQTASIQVKHDGTAPTEGDVFVMGW